MTATAPTTEPHFSVLVNAAGRRALWPASKALPAGWRAALTDRPRSDCLAFVERPVAAVLKSARPTIGFGLMFFGSDEDGGARGRYAFLIEAAKFADENGFTAVWLPERHFARLGSLYPNPAVLHAALSRETRRIRLRAGSVVLPLHHPARVAEEWAVVDNLSGGRVELSFAPGWNADDFALKPEHYPRRYEVMYEGIRTVQRLWAGETIEAASGDGRPVRVRTYPTPVQPKLPVWVTAANSPRSFEQAGEIGADLLTHLFDQDIEELAQKIALYRAARERNGHDPAAGRVAVALHTFLAATDADVRCEAHGAYCAYLKAHAPMLEKLAHSRGVPIDVSQLTPQQLDEAVEWVVEKFLRQRALLGTPEGCTDLVAKLAEIGVQEIACLLDFGPTPEAMLASLTHLRALKEQFRSSVSG